MPVNTTIAANLLIPSALEALLSQAASRLDLNARLERLHAAALMECALKGHAGLKISDVAQRAKVSTASIYKTYKDRDELLVAAMETLFTILASDVIEIPPYQDPKKQVEQLLMAHGEVYSQPLSTWLFRLYASLSWSGQTHLRQTALQVFRGIDAFWCGFLSQLVADGHLVACELEHVVPHLLGPIERCTIMWQLGCGDDDDRSQILAAVAGRSAHDLFELWGQRAVGQAPCEAPSTSSFPINRSPQAPQSRVPSASIRLSEKLASAQRLGSLEETQSRILLAASVLCQEVGYHNAGMGLVAEYAKVSTATLYKHYRDKTDLFCAALEQEFNLRVAFDDEVFKRDFQPGNPQAILASAILEIAARAKDPDWAWMYLVIKASEISGTPRMKALARRHRITTEAYLESAMNALSASSQSNNARSRDEIALIINSLLGGVERCGILSLILFGSESVETKQLEQLASFATSNQARLLESAD
jgi:AcrR family transcriptional regulator